jgi:hypothetical protein
MCLLYLTLCHRFCSAQVKFDIMSSAVVVGELCLDDKGFERLSYIYTNVCVI